MNIKNKIKNYKFYILFLIIGLILFTYPIFTSNFQKIPGELADSRFVAYILEHYYYWVLQEETHQVFWNMPIFYPLTNTMAYSDVLLGIAIFYLPLRFFINNPFSIIQIIFILFCFINYTSFYVLLKDIFKFKDLSCGCGAFSFAFSLVLLTQIIHLQFFTQFYWIFAILFAFYGFNGKSVKQKYFYYLLSGIFLVLQFWTSYYLGYYLILGSIFTLSIFIFFKNSRNNIINWLRKDYKFIITSLILVSVLLLPLFNHYLATNAKFTLYNLLLHKIHFINLLQNLSYIDNLLLPFNTNLDLNRNLSCGIFTSIIGIIGLYKFKNYRKQIFIFIISLLIIFYNPFLVKVLYHIFPLTVATRVIYRVSFIINPLISVGLANFIENNHIKKFLPIILCIFLLEQIPTQNMFMYTKQDHQQRISQYTVDKSCNEILLFYIDKSNNNYSPEYEMDGMWLGMKYRLPTYNGYSGIIPEIRKVNITHPPCIIKAK